MPYMLHPNVSTPDDDVIIWRYMNFVKFVHLLQNDTLHFCRSDRLGDPFEGSSVRNVELTVANVNVDGTESQPPAELRNLGDLEVTVRDNIARGRQRVRDFMYISCWYSRPHDSAAMWAIYANVTDGVAIKSTVGRLKRALGGAPQDVVIGAVEYVDYETAIAQWGNAFPDFLRKRLSFEHEHEVRAIILVFEEPSPLGLDVPVDVSALIEEIVVAPQAEAWFATLVRQSTERYGLDIEPRYSPLADTPFWG
jgi:hypothetical protein